MNGTLVRATALALLSMLLAGCGGGDGDATPTFSSTPTPTAQTTSASPATSSSSPVTETPEAFISRWNESSTVMQNAGETASYRAISRGCVACQKTADLVDEYYAAGGYVHTKGWMIRSTSCKRVSADKAECLAHIINTVTRYKESGSAPVKTFPSGPFAEYFKVSQTGGAWNMTYIAQEAQ